MHGPSCTRSHTQCRAAGVDGSIPCAFGAREHWSLDADTRIDSVTGRSQQFGVTHGHNIIDVSIGHHHVGTNTHNSNNSSGIGDRHIGTTSLAIDRIHSRRGEHNKQIALQESNAHSHYCHSLGDSTHHVFLFICEQRVLLRGVRATATRTRPTTTREAAAPT